MISNKKFYIFGLIIGIFFLLPFNGNSQSGNPAAPGTYQFRCTDIKKPLSVFTTDILYTIEAKRDSLVVKTIWVSETMKVRILPYAEILAPGFIPLNEDIVFEKLSPDIYNEIKVEEHTLIIEGK